MLYNLKIESKTRAHIGPYNKSLAIFNDCFNFPIPLPKIKEPGSLMDTSMTICSLNQSNKSQ